MCFCEYARTCYARDIGICSTGDHIGYAAQSDLFDVEGHQLRLAWFETASLIPLPDSGATRISSRTNADANRSNRVAPLVNVMKMNVMKTVGWILS